MAAEMNSDRVAEAYGRWAPIYDIVFGPVFRRGRRAAVDAAERIGGRILEVGVGTGLSLASYSKASRVVGIDISEPMLAKARERVEKTATRSGQVHRGDGCRATRLSDDAHSTWWWRNTSSPRSRIRSRRWTNSSRVVRPGGEIIIDQPGSAPRRACAAALEKMADAADQPAGLAHGVSLGALSSDGCEWSPAVRLLEKRALPPLGHFWLMRILRLPDVRSARSLTMANEERPQHETDDLGRSSHRRYRRLDGRHRRTARSSAAATSLKEHR